MQNKKEITLPEKKSHMPLQRINYILLLAGCALILIGFALMVGGKAEDPSTFNPEIFNFQRITLSPIIILIGFALNIMGIMYRKSTR